MKLIIHKGVVPKDAVVYVTRGYKMEAVLFAIGKVVEQFLGHKDARVVFQGVAIELIKHLLKNNEKDLEKEDILRIIEALCGVKKQ